MINGIPRILIVRLSSIGDVVRVLPALHALREEHPNAQIDWAVEEKSLDIVSGHPELDKVHVFRRSDRFWQSAGRFLRFCGEVRKCRYDIVLDFHGVFKSGVVTGLSRAPKRYGFAKPRSREGSYFAINVKVCLNGTVLNRVEENLRLCEKVAPRRDSQQVPCFVPEEIRDEVEEYFANAFHGAKLVVAMHVAMDRPEKQWPVEHFASLSDMLLADGRFDVVLTCGPDQRAAIDAVLEKTRRIPEVAPEMPSLKHYMWLVRCSDLYFGGDTGPMHIASAMGTPVAVVFMSTDPARHSPVREPFEVLVAMDQPDELGTGNSKAPRPGGPGLVSPEAAFDACVRLVS